MEHKKISDSDKFADFSPVTAAHREIETMVLKNLAQVNKAMMRQPDYASLNGSKIFSYLVFPSPPLPVPSLDDNE